MKRPWPLCFVLPALLCASCATVGPKSIRTARFSYAQAISDTRNQQLLTNLVRLRYRDPPLFLDVSSVSTQYVFGAGGGAEVGGVGGTAIGSIDGAVAYEERPTITYLPLQGADFADRLLSPIRMETVVLLTYAGWRVDRVLRCSVQRLNELWNAPTASGPTPERAPTYETFLEAARLLELLNNAEALQLRYRPVAAGDEATPKPAGKKEERHVLSLWFSGAAETSAEADRLKRLLGLPAEVDEFHLTSNPTVRRPDEIGLLPRSLMGVMSYLSQAVEPPQADIDAGRVTETRRRDGTEFRWSELMDDLFTIRSSPEPPENAFVRVKYRGSWFYIDDSDLTSKSTFNLLDQLFQLQAGAASGATPVLTLPLN